MYIFGVSEYCSISCIDRNHIFQRDWHQALLIIDKLIQKYPIGFNDSAEFTPSAKVKQILNQPTEILSA